MLWRLVCNICHCCSVLLSLSHSLLLLKADEEQEQLLQEEKLQEPEGCTWGSAKAQGFRCWWPWLLAHPMIRAGRCGGGICASHSRLGENEKYLPCLTNLVKNIPTNDYWNLMWEKYFQELLYSLERDLVLHSYQRVTGQRLFSLSFCCFTHSWKCLRYHGWSTALVFTVL